MDNSLPKSQIKCLIPLEAWNANGNAIADLAASLARSGKPAKAPIKVAESNGMLKIEVAAYATVVA